MNLSGLSFEALPPINLPFRFFVTAILMAIGAGIFVAYSGEVLWTSRWHPSMLALTHLIVLGVISMVMIGALLQIMPVVGGTGIPHVNFVAKTSHLTLTIGTLLLSASFVFYAPWLKWFSIVFLSIAFVVFISALFAALAKKFSQGATILVVRFACAGLIITVVLGVLLQVARAGELLFFSNKIFTNIHAITGIAGWVGLLIIGVSYQVIPMFHVAPSFPARFSRALPCLVFGLVLFLLGLTFFGAFYAPFYEQGNAQINGYVILIVLLLFVCYCLYFLELERVIRRRRRSIADVTVNYWRFALYAFISVFVMFLVAVMTEFSAAISTVLAPELLSIFLFESLLSLDWTVLVNEVLIASVLIYGVVLSVIQGLLLKILPFLSYTHLQQKCMVDFSAMQCLPNMHEFLVKRHACILLIMHMASTAALVAVIVQPPFYAFFAVLCIVEFVWLLFLMLKCINTFRATEKKISLIIQGTRTQEF